MYLFLNTNNNKGTKISKTGPSALAESNMQDLIRILKTSIPKNHVSNSFLKSCCKEFTSHSLFKVFALPQDYLIGLVNRCIGHFRGLQLFCMRRHGSQHCPKRIVMDKSAQPCSFRPPVEKQKRERLYLNDAQQARIAKNVKKPQTLM